MQRGAQDAGIQSGVSLTNHLRLRSTCIILGFMNLKAETVIAERRPKEVVRALEQRAPELIGRLDRVVNKAVHGSPAAVREYIKLWSELRHLLLKLTQEAWPGLVVEVEDSLLLADAKGNPSEIIAEILDQAALYAPFSPWVAKFGPGRGVALCLLSELRRASNNSEPLVPEDKLSFPFPDLSKEEFRRFANLVWHELTASDPLEMIASTFELSETHLGDLFGVTRQAVSQWRDKGIPAERRTRLHSIQRIADVLRRNLKQERIPAVVRKPAQAYGKRSMLEAIRRGDENKVLEEVERAFDWATTA